MRIYIAGLSIDVNYTKGDPGQYGGPPDAWRQPEGAEVEIVSAKVDDPEEWAACFDEPCDMPEDLKAHLEQFCYDEIAEKCEEERTAYHD